MRRSPASTLDSLDDAPHALSAKEILRRLEVDLSRGLDSGDVARRRRVHGPNLLREVRRRTGWEIALTQTTSLIFWLLLAVTMLSFALGDWAEGAAVLVVIALNSAIGFTTEIKATRSMESLRRIGRVTTKVRREGTAAEVDAASLVPGDIVLLEAGDVVTADLRLAEAANLQCDESTLTGESEPVAKQVEPVVADSSLGDRSCMVHKGTAVVTGSGLGIVVATGMASQLGRISSLVDSADAAASPLERRLDRLSGQLVWAALVLAALVALSGLHAGVPLAIMSKTAIALAIAAVPEGLPVVATLALARGMWRMARRNVLVERLSAVETLGATTVILTDKTGTLTENRMMVTRILLDEGTVTMRHGAASPFALDGRSIDATDADALLWALRTGVLCSNAELSGPVSVDGHHHGVGDPIEIALLGAARVAGIERDALLARWPEAREEPFTTERRIMATVHADNGGFRAFVKGAPEVVIGASTSVLGTDGPRPLSAHGRRAWLDACHAVAAEGLRILALATAELEGKHDDHGEALTLVGVVALLDPLRADIPDALAACRRAGVRVIMLTGDHVATACTIARDAGLGRPDGEATIESLEIDDIAALSNEEKQRLRAVDIFARVSPQTKLQLVALHQEAGEIVAMTGDGVNDAPALKKADIGIAMGLRGTQVARDAAHIVLRDDSFASIVRAMEEGRVIFANLRRFVLYLLSCNLGEILVIAAAMSIGLPLPLLPLQILFLNLVTDVFPALALGAGRGAPGLMEQPPRPPSERILEGRHWASIMLHAATMTVAVLSSFAAALFWLRLSEAAAVTVAFLTLALAQLWHVVNMRVEPWALFDNEITRNGYVWAALGLCTAIVGAGLYLTPLATTLSLVPLKPLPVLLAVGTSLLPLVVGPLVIMACRARPPRAAR